MSCTVLCDQVVFFFFSFTCFFIWNQQAGNIKKWQSWQQLIQSACSSPANQPSKRRLLLSAPVWNQLRIVIKITKDSECRALLSLQTTLCALLEDAGAATVTGGLGGWWGLCKCQLSTFPPTRKVFFLLNKAQCCHISERWSNLLTLMYSKCSNESLVLEWYADCLEQQ